LRIVVAPVRNISPNQPVGAHAEADCRSSSLDDNISPNQTAISSRRSWSARRYVSSNQTAVESKPITEREMRLALTRRSSLAGNIGPNQTAGESKPITKPRRTGR